MLLGLVALTGLKPWGADSVEPHLGPLGLEMAVGDSVALPSAPAAFVADAAVAPGKAKLVARPTARHGSGQADGDLGIAPARVVAVSVGEPPPTPTPTPVPASPAPEAQPVAAPAPEGAPVPVTGPIAAGEGAPSSPGGPISSGGGGFEESCEGDEYVLTISFTGEEPSGGESPVEILLQRLNDDGSVDELELEGDLFDAQELLAQLTSEGNCVEVEIVPSEPAEPVFPAPPVSPVEP
ncbi:MAG: hypothetical protein QOF13_1345 [Solirubrobacterales bacterium]|nr:hypothetical protein [Solirubrobacterales bacterium]